MLKKNLSCFLLIAGLLAHPLTTTPAHSEKIYSNYENDRALPIEPLHNTTVKKTKVSKKIKRNQTTKARKPYAATWLMWGFLSLEVSVLLSLFAVLLALSNVFGALLAVLLSILAVSIFTVFLIFSIMGIVQAIRNRNTYNYTQHKRTAIWLLPLLLTTLFSAGFLISTAISQFLLGLLVLAVPILALLVGAVVAFVFVFSKVIRQEKDWQKETPTTK